MVLRRRSIRAIPCFITIVMIVMSIVLMPSPSANAIVGVDDILFGGSIIAFLQGMGISIGMGSNKNSQWLANSIYNDLKTYAATAGVITLPVDWNQYFQSEVNVYKDENGQFHVRYSEDVATLLKAFGNNLISQYGIVAHMNQIVQLNYQSSYFLADGSELRHFVFDGYGGYSSPKNKPEKFYAFSDTQPVHLVFNDGTTLTLTRTSSSPYTYTLSVPSGAIMTYQNTHQLNYMYFGFNASGTIIEIGLAQYSTNRTRAWQNVNQTDWFSKSTYESTIVGQDLIPDIGIPEQDDDEYGWVSLPWSVTSDIPDNYTDTDILGSVVDGALSGINTNEGLQEYEYSVSTQANSQTPTPDVNNVQLPLIGITFPANFTLGLSGIWYYVRQWINSIGSWFAWCFNVYSMLPYAMIVPIYASVVILVVVGLYRRFFM